MDGAMTDSDHMIDEAAIAGLSEYGIEPEPANLIPW